MNVLNLYAGLGGNRKHWKDCSVTAVESNERIANVYRDNYPDDEVVVGEAKSYLLHHYNDFDFIWASPPCQSHSRMVKFSRNQVKRYPDMSLYQTIILLQEHFKGQWLVENVKPYYKPLISADHSIGRHYFWTNMNLFGIEDKPRPKGFINMGSLKDAEKLKEWIGIKFEGSLYYDGNNDPCQVLRNCVHPDLGGDIFNRARKEQRS